MSLLPPRIHPTAVPPLTASIPPPSGPPLGHDHLLWLGAAGATDPARTGAKAAALARAAAAGLPIVPGVVLTTDAVAALGRGDADPATLLATAWAVMGTGTDDPSPMLVVRSSSTVEDQGQSSMAGLFHSVLGVDTPASFRAAVMDVIDSARSDVVTAVAGEGGAPMAVLVQRQVDAVIGGVLFGADPMSGRRDRLVVSVALGTPDALVSGLVNGTQMTLTRRGRVVSVDGDPAPDALDADVRRRLAALAARTERVFGAPQDMEWALDRGGVLWLLQSRPITTGAAAAPKRGTVWGQGPVAETFPRPLRRLEADLWVEPLSEGIEHALRLTGAVPPRPRRRDQAVVRTVGGWVVADLDRLGANPVKRRSLIRKLDPRPPSWRLRSAWRVGRLSLAVGAIGRDVVLSADAALAEVPPPVELDDAELIGTLLTARRSLVALHAHEALAGMLIAKRGGDQQAAATSSVVAAHRALQAARSEGWSDDEIVAREPSVLALVVPSIPPNHDLPATVSLDDLAPTAVDDTDAGVVREALRLRIRWTHELMAQLAVEAGRRLTQRAALPHAEAVGDVGLPELLDGLRARRPCPIEVVPLAVTPPPPDVFRLTADGLAAALPKPRRDGDRAGLGAGGGRGTGIVWHAADGVPPAGAVLVTRFLEPGLAAHLPGLAGLVAETGSVLSHLAIVARELGVPTVVAATGALERYPAGTRVALDGDTGDITVMDDPVNLENETAGGPR